MGEIKTGRRLILANGSIYENAEAGYADGFLLLFMRKTITLHDAANIFFNHENTNLIVFEYGEMEDRFENFTHVVNLMENADEEVTVALKQE